jgi:ParB-like chromosome segregation protein Spo0J
MRISLVPVDALKPHESTSRRHLARLKRRIINDCVLKMPVLADKKTLVLLDGHHRLLTLKQLGIKKIPAMLVDYESNEIIVKSRRKNLKVDKRAVISMGLSKKVFPPKTTKHILKKEVKKCDIPLELLV